MYTHTAEGQIFAVEQETGRLLWREYFPGVHICYTSPLYVKERLLVPQAGLDKCRLRTMHLPDIFQDHDTPDKQYETAGLTVRDIVKMVYRSV